MTQAKLSRARQKLRAGESAEWHNQGRRNRERERQLVWSFDISKPAREDITEVQVDAKTGKIIRFPGENVARQAKEAAEDQKDKR